MAYAFGTGKEEYTLTHGLAQEKNEASLCFSRGRRATLMRHKEKSARVLRRFSRIIHWYRRWEASCRAAMENGLCTERLAPPR